MARPLYARLTASGIACAETAVCVDHLGASPLARDTGIVMHPCPGNDALECIVCGATESVAPMKQEG